jgi:hypothetical protein
MRIGALLRFIVLAVVVITALFILRSSSVKPQPAPKELKEECCRGKKCKATEDNNMIWETFSRQFIAVLALPFAPL